MHTRVDRLHKQIALRQNETNPHLNNCQAITVLRFEWKPAHNVSARRLVITDRPCWKRR